MVRRYATSCAVALAILAGLGPGPSMAEAQGDRAGGAPPRAAAARAIDYGTAHLDRHIQAVRAAGPIALDGVLDEPAWNDAPMAANFIQNDPREGEPATFDTEVRVLYDDAALYFGVLPRTRNRGGSSSTTSRRISTPTAATVSASSSIPFTTSATGISSPPIPPEPSGTPRCPTRGARTTRTGTASGT